MKVVAVDNLNRETIADHLVAENVTKEQGDKIADEYNKKQKDGAAVPDRWAIVVCDSYRLSRGMEDLV